MSDLIRREDVIKLILARYENPELCVPEIKRIPTVDAVPVVRCGECKLHKSCTFEETFATVGLAENKRFCGAGTRIDCFSEKENKNAD